MRQIDSYTLLENVIATGAGESRIVRPEKRTYQAVGQVSAATGAATVLVQVSNDDENWMTLGTIVLSLTTSPSSDGFASDAAWKHVRGNVSAISGTDATVSLLVAHLAG